MIPTIITRTIGGNPDNSISLSNGLIVRPVSLPSNWLRLRIGLRWHTTNNGANLITPRLYIGLGSGSTNTIADLTTTNFIGAVILDTFTFNAYPYYSCIAAYGVKRVNSTFTNSAAIAGGGQSIKFGAAAGSATNDFQPFILELTKGSPNFTIGCYYYNGTTPQVSPVSSSALLTEMMIVSPSYFSLGGQTLAFSEVAGTLDTIQIYFNKEDIAIEISDLVLAVVEYS